MDFVGRFQISDFRWLVSKQIFEVFLESEIWILHKSDFRFQISKPSRIYKKKSKLSITHGEVRGHGRTDINPFWNDNKGYRRGLLNWEAPRLPLTTSIEHTHRWRRPHLHTSHHTISMKGDMRRLFQSKGWTHCGEDKVWSSAESHSGQAHSRPEWTLSTQLCCSCLDTRKMQVLWC